MDSHPFYRYADSQDHLIISLNQQIQKLIPLKESYAALQRYHIKITQDLQSLLTDNDHVSQAYSYKIKELGVLNDQLDNKKTRYVDEIRKMENQKAKLILQRKNLICSCQTLGSKFNLQNQQNMLQQDRARDLIDSSKKIQHGIELYKKLINELENGLKIKNMQKNQLQEDMRRRMLINQKLTNNCENIQKGIQNMQNQNKQLYKKNNNLQDEINKTQIRIRQQILKGKELNQNSIKKKQQLSNLLNQKQYYCRLIQSQIMIKEDIQISLQKLGHLMQKRTNEYNKLSEENKQIRNKIEEQQKKLQKNNNYKQALKNHLSQLIQTNCILIEEMQKFCGQDQKTHKLLNDKVNRLQLSCEKVRNNRQNFFQKKTNNFLKNRINQGKFQAKDVKSGLKTDKSWINQLRDIQNIQLK